MLYINIVYMIYEYMTLCLKLINVVEDKLSLLNENGNKNEK